MKSRLLFASVAILAVAFIVAPASLRTQHANAAVRGLSVTGLNSIQRRLLSGFASFEAGIGVSTRSASARVGARVPSSGSGSSPDLCPGNIRSNVLVNQNCLNVTDADLQGRGQSQNETAIAQNPLNPRQVVGAYNDYRRGDSTCYGATSSNGGSSQQPRPVERRLRVPLHR
jgi:hypothetical protein